MVLQVATAVRGLVCPPCLAEAPCDRVTRRRLRVAGAPGSAGLEARVVGMQAWSQRQLDVRRDNAGEVRETDVRTQRMLEYRDVSSRADNG